MTKLNIRPRLTMTAFQWDGSDVAGYQRVPNIMGLTQNATDAPFLLRLENQWQVKFAAPGDWVVDNGGGQFPWPADTFHETYEVIRELEGSGRI